jgi:hypothetical protein
MTILSSCDTQTATGGFTFANVQTERTAHLFGDTLNPACQIQITYSYIDAADDELLKDKVNAIIASSVFDETFPATSTAQQMIDTYADRYVDYYLESVSPMYEEDKQKATDEQPIDAWYNYSYNIQSSVSSYAGDLLVYQIYTDRYEGGAHGMHQNRFINYDLKNQRALQLSDLFIENSYSALTDLLWSQLAADNNVSSRQALEDIGYGITGDLVPSENFFIEKDAITFVYNAYEIAPYSVGTVYIRLPVAMLRPLLANNAFIK